MAEVGDGLEVGCEPSSEPHQLDVALGLALQATAGLNAIQVAVDVELQLHRRVIRRSTSGGWIHALEAERLKIQFLDERVNDAHRVVFADIVIQTLGQQNNLVSIFAFDESLHGHLAENGCNDFISMTV